MNTGNDELAHYGVKGMKWGRRSGGSGSKGPRKTHLQKVNDKRSAKGKHKLTQEQLNYRMQLGVKAATGVAIVYGPRAARFALDAAGSAAVHRAKGRTFADATLKGITDAGANLKFAKTRRGVANITSVR